MRKIVSLVLGIIMSFSVLGVLAGCGEAKLSGKARDKVLAAAFEAEISAFELTMHTKAESKSNSGGSTTKVVMSQELTMLACEKEGQAYGDLFMNVLTRKFIGGKEKSSADVFTVSFLRGNDVYTASESWGKFNAKKREYEALIEEYRSSGEPLVYSRADYYDTSDMGASDATVYLALSEYAGGTVYRTESGYRVDFDLVKAAGNIFKKLKDVTSVYEASPNMTVGELFEAAGVGGMEDVVFLSEVSEERRATYIFGEPSEFLERLNQAAKNPKSFILSEAFNFSNAAAEKGTFDYTITMELDKDMAVTGMVVSLNVNAVDEGNFGYLKSLSLESEITFTVLENSPELTELAGLRVDMGYLVTPGTYEFDANRYFIEPVRVGDFYYWVTATGIGRVTIREDGTAEITLSAIAEITLSAIAESSDVEEIGSVTETKTIALPSLNMKKKCVFFRSFPMTWEGEARDIDLSGFEVVIEHYNGGVRIYRSKPISYMYEFPTEHRIITLE